jgi:hypothetical protein
VYADQIGARGVVYRVFAVVEETLRNELRQSAHHGGIRWKQLAGLEGL